MARCVAASGAARGAASGAARASLGAPLARRWNFARRPGPCSASARTPLRRGPLLCRRLGPRSCAAQCSAQRRSGFVRGAAGAAPLGRPSGPGGRTSWYALRSCWAVSPGLPRKETARGAARCGAWGPTCVHTAPNRFLFAGPQLLWHFFRPGSLRAVFLAPPEMRASAAEAAPGGVLGGGRAVHDLCARHPSSARVIIERRPRVGF